MKQRVLGNPAPLSMHEREMFSLAYKNSLTERRQALRILGGIEKEYQEPDSQYARDYASKVKTELTDICDETVSCIQHLEPNVEPGEPKTFYLKMKGDYYRYKAEFADHAAKDNAAQEAAAAYTQGMNEASVLPGSHPVRLGLALNYSVFVHEVLHETAKAISTAT